MRLSKNSQFAKFGSIRTFKSVNWIRNDAWPIQVTATWPCDKFRENRMALLTGARRQQRLPDQFAEKRARIEMFRRRQILERARQFPARRRGLCETGFVILTFTLTQAPAVNKLENAVAHPCTSAVKFRS